jgi:hypothetical protein
MMGNPVDFGNEKILRRHTRNMNHLSRPFSEYVFRECRIDLSGVRYLAANPILIAFGDLLGREFQRIYREPTNLAGPGVRFNSRRA